MTAAWALALKTWALSAFLAADIARCESSADFPDGAAVLQVVRNRTLRSGRSMLAEMLVPSQFASGCPTSPRSWSERHVILGLQAAAGTLKAPGWARRALHYTGRYDPPGMCARWRMHVIGRIAHTFCGAGQEIQSADPHGARTHTSRGAARDFRSRKP